MVFPSLSQVWVKVPDNWNSAQVAQYIVQQCAGPNGEFTNYFAAYLMVDSAREGAMERGQEIDTARQKAILSKAASIAEIYVRGMASLTPGGLAALAAYDATTGQYLSAAVEAAFLLPASATVGKGTRLHNN